MNLLDDIVEDSTHKALVFEGHLCQFANQALDADLAVDPHGGADHVVDPVEKRQLIQSKRLVLPRRRRAHRSTLASVVRVGNIRRLRQYLINSGPSMKKFSVFLQRKNKKVKW